MIARGKNCLGSGRFSTFLDSAFVPSNEPLHFLYPRWAKNSFRKHHSVVFTSSSRRPNAHRSYEKPARHHAIDAISPRWISSTHTKIESREESDTDNTYSTTQSEHSIVHDVVKGGRDKSSERLDNNSLVGEADQQTDHGKESEVSVADVASDMSRGTATTGDMVLRKILSVLPPLAARKRVTAERMRAQERNRLLSKAYTFKELKKLRYRKHIHLWRRRHFTHQTPWHWTDVMALLEKMRVEMPVEPKATKQKEILVREEVVAYLSGTPISEENIWFIQIRNGCQIRVLDPSQSEGIYRKVILSGSKRVIELVEKRIEHIAEQQRQLALKKQTGGPDMRRPCVPIVPSMLALREKGAPIPLVRSVWDDDNVSQFAPSTLSKLRAGSTVRLSSTRAFARYVEQLVRTEKFCQPRSPWDAFQLKDNVRKSLVALFTQPEHQPYFSTCALNTALTFLTKHEYLNSTRLVFKVARAVASTETYNIFLRSTAKRQDLWFFYSMLQELSRLKIQPNGNTWVAFLQCLISPGPRSQVMLRMTELGLMKDRRVLLDVLQYNIGLMLSAHLKKGLDIPSFIKNIETEYGNEAISTYLLNLTLEEVVSKRDHSLLTQILESFRRYELSPNSRTFQLALSHFRHFGLAMENLFEFIHHYEIFLESFNYERLFRLAVKSNAYNACRVLWRYACMKGKTTGLMRQIVRSSLLGDIPKQGHDTAEDLGSRVGALVVGLEYQQGIQPSGFATTMVPPLHAENPVVYLIQYMSPNDRKKKSLVSQLILDDIRRGPTRQPVESLCLMLDAAMKLDKETRWASPNEQEATMSKQSTITILKNMINVPIR